MLRFLLRRHSFVVAMLCSALLALPVVTLSAEDPTPAHEGPSSGITEEAVGVSKKEGVDVEAKLCTCPLGAKDCTCEYCKVITYPLYTSVVRTKPIMRSCYVLPREEGATCKEPTNVKDVCQEGDLETAEGEAPGGLVTLRSSDGSQIELNPQNFSLFDQTYAPAHSQTLLPGDPRLDYQALIGGYQTVEADPNLIIAETTFSNPYVGLMGPAVALAPPGTDPE